MRRRHAVERMTSPPLEWSRRQLQGLLAVLVAAAALLSVGVVLLVTSGGAHPDGGPGAPHASTGTSPSSDEDRIANEPMPSAQVEAARPGQLSTDAFAPIVIPTASRLGRAGVPSGFPQTLDGAIAQLAAIDQAALEGASVSTSPGDRARVGDAGRTHSRDLERRRGDGDAALGGRPARERPRRH